MMHETVKDIETQSNEPPDARRDAGRRDRALFTAFLSGDDQALVSLFDRHNERLFRYCVQFVGNVARAEDITQELWERLLRLRNEGKSTAENPAGFLLRIVRNMCIDDIRRVRPHATLDTLADEHHPIEEIPELTHLEEIVILSLPHLPSELREVLVLHEYSGYAYDEISVMLGETVGAIRTRAWRARAHLGRVVAAMLGMRQDGGDGNNSGTREATP